MHCYHSPKNFPRCAHQTTLPPHTHAYGNNSGGGGARDVRLEDFSVSNGGRELIENGSVVLAHGRRYGLVRRGGGAQ